MSSPAANDHPEAPLFSDGLGERVVAADGATGELLQILRLRPALTAVPSFEFALRERVARLANFRHAYYVRVRRVDRGMGAASSLAVVSDHVEGTRLSDILRVAHERRLQIDINAALCLIRQLVPAVSVLHENARDVAHGLIAPERLVVTPNARLVIVEHVLGAAIEQLQYGRDRLWQEFRVAMPPSAGLPRFDHRADVAGMGLAALALILGRPLSADDYPHHIPALLDEARERSALGDEQPLSPPLRTWLARALQVDVRRSFASAPEAMVAFEELVSDDSMYVAAPVALETFLSRYIASLLEPPMMPEPVVQARVAPVVAPVQRAQAVPAYAEPQAAALDAAAYLESFAPAPVSAPPPAPVLDQARDIRELLGAAPLVNDEPTFTPASHAVPPVQPPEPAHEVGQLFNPDAPFTARATAHPAPRAKRGRPRVAVLAAVVLALAAAGVVAVKFYPKPVVAPAMGALVVHSTPAGVAVFVDGVERGRTPARVTLAPGAHILELRGRGVPRVIPLNVSAGAEVSQYLEFADTPETGQMAIQSDPAGAKVVVDGVVRGVAPLTITDLAPGDHQVELQADGASARHTVNVQAGGHGIAGRADGRRRARWTGVGVARRQGAVHTGNSRAGSPPRHDRNGPHHDGVRPARAGTGQ